MHQRLAGSGFTKGLFNQRELPPSGSGLFGMVPPGYGELDFGEDQVKNFLKTQRQVQEQSAGLVQPPNNSNNPKWARSQDEWSGPTIPAGPNSFVHPPPNSDSDTVNIKQRNNGDKKSSGNTPEREVTPTPEDNMDFGEDPAISTKKEETPDEKSISQRKVYEELQRKHKEKEMRLEPVKEPNPMFKEDNWYSSEEESEEKSDRSFTEELFRTPGNVKCKSPENKTGIEEHKEIGITSTLQAPAVTATILNLRETPATPPPPPTLTASDRDSMEASATTNGSVALPKELTQVLSSIQTTSLSSTSFESNTSSPGSGKRDPR